MSQSADFIHKEVRVKRPRLEKDQQPLALPSSVVARFCSAEGERTGPQVEVPVGTSNKQLEVLVNSLLENEDPVSVVVWCDDDCLV